MFTKQDEEFDQTAADPTRRREAIVDFSRRRNIMFWAAIGMTLCALAIFFISLRHDRGSAAVGFAAAVQWMLLFKFESELRLLRAIERLQTVHTKAAE
jgi:hypothetical protein